MRQHLTFSLVALALFLWSCEKKMQTGSTTQTQASQEAKPESIPTPPMPCADRMRAIDTLWMNVQRTDSGYVLHYACDAGIATIGFEVIEEVSYR